MNLDWFVFPSPDCSYSYDQSQGELLYIPKTQNDIITLENTKGYIPCMFLRSGNSSNCPKFAIFFHGNAEDINLSYEITNHIRYTLNVTNF